MRKLHPKAQSLRRRRALVLIYTTCALFVLLGFASLALDGGHLAMVNTELRRAADAASRAGAANLPNGDTAVKTAAILMASHNNVDGLPVAVMASDVLFVNWNDATHTGTIVAHADLANAVQVTTYHTRARGDAVQSVFGSLAGGLQFDESKTSVAQLFTQTWSSSVSAKSNPWLSGEPTGTRASQPDPNYPSPTHKYPYDWAGPIGGVMPDGESYESPVQAQISITPGATLTVQTITNAANPGAKNDPTETSYADPTGLQGGGIAIFNDDASDGVEEHGMADVYTPINSMVGVFLTDDLPDDSAAPPVLDFSAQSARDYTSFSPQNKQPFYVGSGQTSTGQQQEIIVPKGATRFFLGTMDGHEWNNNVGSFYSTITQTYIEIVK